MNILDQITQKHKQLKDELLILSPLHLAETIAILEAELLDMYSDLFGEVPVSNLHFSSFTFTSKLTLHYFTITELDYETLLLAETDEIGVLPDVIYANIFASHGPVHAALFLSAKLPEDEIQLLRDLGFLHTDVIPASKSTYLSCKT